MQFRRNVQRDERRRRVLIDQSISDEGAAQDGVAGGEPCADRPRYSDEARHSRQPPLTSLIAKRGFLWFVLLGLAASVIVGIEALYGQFEVMRPSRTLPPLLHPLQPGGLATWFTSSLSLIGAVSCVLVYMLRRHRIDDYRGGYRYWIWAAVLFVLASIDSATGADRLIEGVVANGALWWIGGWMLLSGVLLIVLGPELFGSRAAAFTLLVAGACFALIGAIRLDLFLNRQEPLTVMLQSTAQMLGFLSIVSCVNSYARFVYLDANGMLPERAATRKAEAKEAKGSRKRTGKAAAKDEVKSETMRRKKRSDLDAPVGAEPDEPSEAEAEGYDEDEAEGDENPRRASKSERRRQRKQKRRQRAA